MLSPSIIALTSGNSIKALVTALEKNDINPKFTLCLSIKSCL